MEVLVSVIVPVYNAASYLNNCVQSVLAQTYSKLELILVDDGSRDDSGAICETIAASDSRVRVVHQINQGVSAARNTGLNLAKGKYCAFVDSDDTVMSDYLETAVNLSEAEQADLTCLSELCPGDIYWPDGHILRDEVISLENDEARLIYLLNRYSLCELGFSPHGKLFRTAFLKENGFLFATGIQLGEDLLFQMQCVMRAEKIVSSAHVAYCYYQRESSLMEGKRDNVTLAEYDSFLECLNPLSEFWKRYLPVIYMRTMDIQFRQKPADEMAKYLYQLQGRKFWREMVRQSCHCFGKFIHGLGLKDGAKLYLKTCLFGTILGNCSKPYDCIGRIIGRMMHICVK